MVKASPAEDPVSGELGKPQKYLLLVSKYFSLLLVRKNGYVTSIYTGLLMTPCSMIHPPPLYQLCF